MQDLTCDDCTLMNNDISTNVKTIDPCAVSLTSYNGNPNDSKSSPHSLNDSHVNNININNDNNNHHDNSNKYNVPLLRGIKLEDPQDDFFASQPNEVIKSEAHTPPTTVQQLTQKQVSTPTSANQQHQQHRFQPHHNHHHQQQQHHDQYHHHHHHQLLLHGSDDPLISHGAENVINDEDQSVELKHLLTAVSNGKKEQQNPSPQQQQQKLQHVRQQHHQQQRSHQSKFMPSPTTGLVQKRTQNGCSSLTKQQLKMKAGLMSAAQQNQQQQQTQQQQQQQQQRTAPSTQKSKPKSRKKAFNGGNTGVKLRFHHQALPPEYLSHYEATQRQQKQSVPPAAAKLTQTAKLPPAKSSHENVRSWLQKIAEIQRSAQRLKQQQQPQQPHQPQQQTLKQTPSEIAATNDANNNHQTCRMLDSHSPMFNVATQSGVNCERIPSIAANVTRPAQSQSQSHSSNHARMLNYADLPYMGEMTLNNSKPRRGRKPKKADICHLIYKNYGTIFAKNPPPPNAKQTPQQIESAKQQISSASSSAASSSSSLCEEQPLNLCLRDSQSLDLCSVSSEDGNCDAEISECGSGLDSDAGDTITDAMLATNMKSAMANLEDQTNTIKVEPIDVTSEHILHPVTAYYRKLLESGILLKHSDSNSSTIASTIAGLPIDAIETIEKDNQIALKIPIPSGFFLATSSKQDAKPLLPDYPEPLSTPSSIKSEQSSATITTTATATTPSSSNAKITLTGGSNCNCSCINAQQPSVGTLQKRKRSAIFIPPMPAENATSPANEVSICKFKFTGGVKPTLQEKKMLSVDSDGNYRYYSGTGDKSMRGYEFFPRESLQQSGFLPGVGGAGAFLNATGERISADVPPPSVGLSNELLQIPDSPTGALIPQTTNAATTPSIEGGGSPSNALNQLSFEKCSKNKRGQVPQHENSFSTTTAAQSSSVSGSSPHRKKKTQNPRRTSQREKLERTFKEKGFLIQTQQLESAEGATYCKFRQLKKFTRYLFRNWKDYLPDGQVLQAHNSEDIASQQEAIESLLSSQSFDVDHHPMPASAASTTTAASDMSTEGK